MRALDAGAAFRVLLYLLLPPIALLKSVPDLTDRDVFFMILLFGVGVPVAIFGLWLELKSIARRARRLGDGRDG